MKSIFSHLLEAQLKESLVDYKIVNDIVMKRTDKGSWSKAKENIEFKQNGAETLYRIDKANWNPLRTGMTFKGTEKY